jgi:Fur family ferric uptake transcriptional regulator
MTKIEKNSEAHNGAGSATPTAKRNTPQKTAVRKALGEANGFVSAGQLHQTLVNQGSAIGLATVYRALAELASVSEADSLTSSDGEILYRACGTEHHHHLICRRCGKTVEIDAGRVEKWADEVAKEHGFANPSHTIDIFGECADCK